MLRLPRLKSGSHTWRLPLSDATAGELAMGLLQDDLESRKTRFGKLLEEDASLTLWAVCRSKHWRNQAPKGTAPVAEWFAENVASLLQWSEDEVPGQSYVEQDRSEHWGDLAANSVAMACCTARLVDAGQHQWGYLCGLLYATQDWLTSCGPPLSIDDLGSATAILPKWLIELLREIELNPPRSFCAKIIAQTKPTLRQDEFADSDDTAWPEGGTDPRVAARQVRTRWQKQEGGMLHLLPRLAERLARLEVLESEFQSMLETEKLEALKALAYGASHEINNPLANISTRAQTLLRDEQDPERRRKLEVINSQAFRAHEMISDMMLFARPPELQLDRVDLVALVDDVIREMSVEAEEQGTELVRVTPDEPLTIQADHTHLSVALKALCRNSLEAVAASGQIQFFVQPADRGVSNTADDVGWSELWVSDTGPGIPPEVRRHLFDPYYSGREAGRGLGLGLSKCWRVVTEHGGQIEVQSELGRGTTFIIRLPNEACPSIRTAG